MSERAAMGQVRQMRVHAQPSGHEGNRAQQKSDG
jgi:hypothetical protein